MLTTSEAGARTCKRWWIQSIHAACGYQVGNWCALLLQHPSSPPSVNKSWGAVPWWVACVDPPLRYAILHVGLGSEVRTLCLDINTYARPLFDCAFAAWGIARPVCGGAGRHECTWR